MTGARPHPPGAAAPDGGAVGAPGLGDRVRRALARLGRAPEPEATLHVRVDGAVQGVGFRRWTQREAERLGLAGWVLNRADGAVEVAAGGPAGAVAELRAALHRGPAHAAVRSVDELPGAEVTTLPRPFAIVRGRAPGPAAPSDR